jgi:hypothetical protein
MRKSRKEEKSSAITHDPGEPTISDWEFFFRDQRAPVLRSQMITALMAGHPFEVERLPTATLLDAVVLSMAARNYLDAEIVDDYNALLERTDAVWKEPTWSRRVFDQTHCGAADFIIRGATAFTCYEDMYIPQFVSSLLEQDPPEYFKRELKAA